VRQELLRLGSESERPEETQTPTVPSWCGVSAEEWMEWAVSLGAATSPTFHGLCGEVSEVASMTTTHRILYE
jgi:hypothetical protein